MADKGLIGQLGTGARRPWSTRTSELVVTAMGFLGVPYRRGGNNADTGFDCSGFVRAMYEQTVGLVLPRRANEQAAATQTIDQQRTASRATWCSSTPCAAPSAMSASMSATASSSIRPSRAPKCGSKT